MGTPFKELGAVAVDRASGEVFVADSGAGFVDVFSSSTGAYETQFGGGALDAQAVAVDEASGDVYVAEPLNDAVEAFKPNGSGEFELLSSWSGAATTSGEFGEVVGVAVDNSTSADAGEVYVVDAVNSVVDVFRPRPAGPTEAQEGEFLGALKGGKLEEPNAVAVSAAPETAGTVYVADSVKGEVAVFGVDRTFEKAMKGAGSPQGTFGKEGAEGNVTGVAVDQTTGDVLVAEAERDAVSELNAAGEWVGWLTSTVAVPLAAPAGVAVGPSGDVYVADTGALVVDVFGAGVVVPDVKSAKVSKVGRGTPPGYVATLNGAIDPDGQSASYRFEWGESTTYGHSTDPVSAGNGNTESKVATMLEGLKPETTYDYRIVGEDENGANYGANVEFSTEPAVSGVSTGAPSNVEPTGATLSGSLEPEKLPTEYYFQYGETTFYGKSTPPVHTIAKAAVMAEETLKGLSSNTTYHYRLLATSAYGTTFGADGKFTTPGPPRITVEATTGVTHEEAAINTQIDPDGLETSYHVEYGETSAYGEEAPIGGQSIGAGDAGVKRSTVLKGLDLRPGVTYHFRVVASNSAGTEESPDQVIPAVLVDSESALSLGASSERLQAQINPLGSDTTYFFQYGTASCQAEPAGCTDVPDAPGAGIGSGDSDVLVGVEAQALAPDTTYYYRVLASNALGTAEGVQQSFTTRPVALPDDRAWELVSPAHEHGIPIEALTREGGWILAAEDGDAITYVAKGVLGEEPQANRALEAQQIISRRGPGGWSTEDIVTPNGNTAKGVAGVGAQPEYMFFTPDLSLALVEPSPKEPTAKPPLAPGVSQETMYVRNDEADSYLPLATEANVAPGTEFGVGSASLRRRPTSLMSCWHPKCRWKRGGRSKAACTSGPGDSSSSSAGCPAKLVWKVNQRLSQRSATTTMSSRTPSPTTAPA